MNELQVAQEIAAGAMPSPTDCGTFSLIALRVSGTGLAERTAIGELVFRSPSIWLTPETLQRVTALPVIAGHPARLLDSNSFAQRVVGQVGYSYFAGRDGVENGSGPDIWCVAKIYDTVTIKALTSGQFSTSPAVAFRKGDGGAVVELPDGTKLLAEGNPSHLDHIAIVPGGEDGAGGGVWDKGGPSSGIRIDNGVSQMDDDMMDTESGDSGADEGKDPMEQEGTPRRVAADEGSGGQMLDKILRGLDSIGQRLDALEKGNRPDAKRRDSSTGVRRTDAASDEMSADERQERMDAQVRWDAAYRQHGEQAPVPVANERPLAYRVRLAKGMQRFGRDGFDRIELNALPKEAFSVVENRIFSDASKAGPEIYPGVMREIKRIDESGRRVSEFFGDGTFFKQLSLPSRRVVKFHTKSPL